MGVELRATHPLAEAQAPRAFDPLELPLTLHALNVSEFVPRTDRQTDGVTEWIDDVRVHPRCKNGSCEIIQ